MSFILYFIIFGLGIGVGICFEKIRIGRLFKNSIFEFTRDKMVVGLVEKNPELLDDKESLNYYANKYPKKINAIVDPLNVSVAIQVEIDFER